MEADLLSLIISSKYTGIQIYMLIILFWLILFIYLCKLIKLNYLTSSFPVLDFMNSSKKRLTLILFLINLNYFNTLTKYDSLGKRNLLLS